jgi:hypothetical protein
LVPLFGATTPAPSKDREEHGALALGGCRLIKLSNNQPIAGGIDRGDVSVEARVAVSAWGGFIPLFGASN